MGEIWFLCMKIKLFVYLLFALCQSASGSVRGHREATQFAAVQVVDYKHFGSVQLLRFFIPHQANRASWRFNAFSTPSNGCPDKIISLYLQAGSYPLITPNNETFPDRFSLGRTHEDILHVTTSNVSVTHTVHHPLPGEWYAGAFTTTPDDKIVQKGLGAGCKYFIEPAMSVDVHGEIQTVEKRQGHVHVKSNDNKFLRFFLNEPAWEYRLRVIGCGVVAEALLSNFLCNITLMARSSALPDTRFGQGEETCRPGPNNECNLRVASPDVGTWQYLSFVNHGNEDIQIQFVLESTVCSGEVYFVAGEELNSTVDCSVLPPVNRYRGYGDYKVIFGVLAVSAIITPHVFLYDTVTTVIPFSLEPRLDIGGTLKTQLGITLVGDSRGVEAVIVGCLQRGSIAFNGSTSLPCEDQPSRLIVLNTSQPVQDSNVLYVPYPEPGTWFLSLVLHCYHTQHSHRVSCSNLTALVEVDIGTSSCVDGGCENSGRCVIGLRGDSRYSTCNCEAGWRGYGCSDGTLAASYTAQLEEALLLTLSNLLFIPAIVVAGYRKFYAEALVYFITMFFSSFYHACDGDRELVYCITHYSTLIACDFFSSVFSFWVTLMAMLQLREPYLPTLMVAGAFGLLYGVLEDKQSLWLFAAPGVSGFTLLVISWGLRCYKRRGCYPSCRRYLFFLLPGVLCAGLGFSLFAFVQTVQNYKYIHSVWHVTMALSIVFVLPPRPAWIVKAEITSPKRWAWKTKEEDTVQVIGDQQENNHANGGIVNVCMNETL